MIQILSRKLKAAFSNAKFLCISFLLYKMEISENINFTGCLLRLNEIRTIKQNSAWQTTYLPTVSVVISRSIIIIWESKMVKHML
jgi:hypothetical protein